MPTNVTVILRKALRQLEGEAQHVERQISAIRQVLNDATLRRRQVGAAVE